LKFQKQSEKFWKVKDSLEASLTNKQMAQLLEQNNQKIPKQSEVRNYSLKSSEQTPKD